MKTKYIKKEFSYDGTQLKTQYNYLEHGVLGDSVVSWVGPCDVSVEHLVDSEDKKAGAFIYSEKMVHFIGEFFHKDIFFGVLFQRLICDLIKTTIEDLKKIKVIRSGDDLFIKGRKLSVSIATKRHMSTLIHFGVNISSKNTPVKTVGLEDLKIKPGVFIKSVLEKIKLEKASIEKAAVKVL